MVTLVRQVQFITLLQIGIILRIVQLGKYNNGYFYVRGGTLATGRDYSTFNMLTARNSSNTVEVFRDGDSSEGSVLAYGGQTFDFDIIRCQRVKNNG